MPSVVAVVLNWNRADETLRCVDHLRAQQSISPDIVVVDNGSTAADRRALEVISPACRLLFLDTNYGFAEGMNRGIADALTRGADFIWLVNNDAFAADDCLAAIVTLMEDAPDVGMATPRLVDSRGVEQHAGGTIDLATGEYQELRADALSGELPDDAWLTGAAPVVRASALTKLGMFDPRFFAYAEDVDLSLRLTRSGWKLRSVPAATVTHVGGASSGGPASARAQYLGTRNTWFVLERYGRGRSIRARRLRYAAMITRRAAIYGAQGRPELSNALFAALSAARSGVGGPPPKELRPAVREMLLSRHPWRAAKVMTSLASWLDVPTTRA